MDDAHLHMLTTAAMPFSLRDRRRHYARLAFGNSFYARAIIFHLQRLIMHSKYGGKADYSWSALTPRESDPLRCIVLPEEKGVEKRGYN